jgi:DNA-binding transcriptional LysR family regulator
MGTPPREFRINAARFAHHPMAFVASPKHALMRKKRVTLDDVVAANLLVRERGSGTRAAIDRLYEDEGVPLAIGSELSSNEAIKQMTAAGLGVGFLSVHACTLEVRNDLLSVLRVPGVKVQGDWYVMHKEARAIPKVAASFHEFMVEHGQQLISDELESFAWR